MCTGLNSKPGIKGEQIQTQKWITDLKFKHSNAKWKAYQWKVYVYNLNERLYSQIKFAFKHR